MLIIYNNTLLYTKPALAESLVEISPDHLEYIYHIKKNAYYSDGTPIDGNDFIFFFLGTLIGNVNVECVCACF